MAKDNIYFNELAVDAKAVSMGRAITESDVIKTLRYV